LFGQLAQLASDVLKQTSLTLSLRQLMLEQPCHERDLLAVRRPFSHGRAPRGGIAEQRQVGMLVSTTASRHASTAEIYEATDRPADFVGEVIEQSRLAG
jgi:hypothetical protein